MNKYSSRMALIFMYIFSKQGLTLFFMSSLMGYACYYFYAIGEVPFGSRSSDVTFYRASEPFLFWLVWLFFFACFLCCSALYIYTFYSKMRRVTELRNKPYS